MCCACGMSAVFGGAPLGLPVRTAAATASLRVVQLAAAPPQAEPGDERQASARREPDGNQREDAGMEKKANHTTEKQPLRTQPKPSWRGPWRVASSRPVLMNDSRCGSSSTRPVDGGTRRAG